LRTPTLRPAAFLLASLAGATFLVCTPPQVLADTLPQALLAPDLAALHSYAGLCAGTAQARGSSPDQAKLVLLENGELSGLHHALPDTMRADSAAAAGLVLCLTQTATTVESCNFGVLLTLPRVRRGYRVEAYSVEAPSAPRMQFTLDGAAPGSCQEAGVLSGKTVIEGALPTAEDLLAALAARQLTADDADGDGFSNLRELVLGANPADSAGPGPELSVSVNHVSALTVREGASVSVFVSFNPGTLRGGVLDYQLHVEAPDGVFSYVYPDMVQPGRVRAARAPAIRLDDFAVMQLQDLEAGTHRLRFEIVTPDGTVLAAQAELTVVPYAWSFTDVTQAAGFNYTHGYSGSTTGTTRDLAVLAGGGVAAGDYDRDGWPDLYVTRGTLGANLLFRNGGDGTFIEAGANAGVALQGKFNAGATFADVDGDAFPDLFVAGFNDTPSTLFHNNGDGSFTDITAESGLGTLRQSFSASFGDIDNDGDVDLWVSHYLFNTSGGYLWRNDGHGGFTDISLQAGIANGQLQDWSASFADIDNDGWQDLLVAGDFGTSRIYRNNRNGTFARDVATRLTDENGMGAAVGDYDNDGDLDWFVSSISDADANQRPVGAVPWGATGNRFYENRGGTFVDVTDATGTRTGNWGWGACFEDFDNDGALDLFQTNGFKASEEMLALVYSFTYDRSRLFVANGAGGFSDQAAGVGVDDDRQGRGIVCFDYDRDGDTDLFIANNEQAPLLYRNDGGNLNHWLQVRLGGTEDAAGARVWLTAGGTTQMRELRSGGNYLSQNPLVASFGLGAGAVADTLVVRWPSGKQAVLHDVQANQALYVLPP
jgi:hypothetical protein